jgi:hypothetical protein
MKHSDSFFLTITLLRISCLVKNVVKQGLTKRRYKEWELDLKGQDVKNCGFEIPPGI